MIRRSFHVGVGKPSWKNHKFDDLSTVPGHCAALAEWASTRGFQAELLAQPCVTTFDSVVTKLAATVDEVKAGGSLFLTFAGHGFASETQGKEPPEAGTDLCDVKTKARESWVLQDKGLLDLDLFVLLNSCSAQTSVVCVSDCCHGNGMAPPGLIAQFLAGLTRWLRRGEAEATRVYTVMDPEDLAATAVFVAPAAEGEFSDPGFSDVFLDVARTLPASWEELRVATEKEWQKRSTAAGGVRVCMRPKQPTVMSPAAFFQAT